MSLLIFGVIVVVAAFAPTSANAVIPNSALAVPDGYRVLCTSRLYSVGTT